MSATTLKPLALTEEFGYCPQGMIEIQPGDVLFLADSTEVMALKNNGCCAIVQPLGKKYVTITDRVTEKQVEFEKPQSAFRIACTIGREHLINRLGPDGISLLNKKGESMKLELGEVIMWQGRRATTVHIEDGKARIAVRTPDNGVYTEVIDQNISELYLAHRPRLRQIEREHELKNFLAVNVSAASELTKPLTDEERNIDMAKAKTKTKAPAKAKTTATKTTAPKAAAGDKPKIFEHSVTAVLRTLGKNEVTSAQATGILIARGFKDKDGKCTIKASTIQTSITDGKSGKYGKPAELTAAQIKELKSQIPAEA